MDDGATRHDPPRDDQRAADDDQPRDGGLEEPTDDSPDNGGWFTYDVDDLPPATLEPGSPSLENAAFVLLGMATALAVWLLLLP